MDWRKDHMLFHNDTPAGFNLSVTDILNRSSKWQKSSFLQMSETIFACVTPVIIAIGLIGNSLSLLVFTSKSLRKLTASSYLAALSVADTSTLVFYVLVEWLRRGVVIINPHAKLDFLDHNGTCQVLLYLAYLSRMMSSWIIVAFTIERFIGICHPLKRFKRGAKKVIFPLFLVASILVIYKPSMSISSTTRGQTACRPNPDLPELLSYVLDLSFALSITSIPFVIITILNILIVRALYIRNRDGDFLSEDANTRIRLEFTVILVAISFFFVAFNFPFTVVWSRYFLTSHPEYNLSSFDKVDNDYWIAVLNITRTVFYMNYCVNFFLYSITGRCFRKNLVKLICCNVSRRNRSYIRCQYIGSGVTSHTTIVHKNSAPQKSETEM